MRILFAAKANNRIVFGATRAPDQARRRLADILSTPVEFVWIDLPANDPRGSSILEDCASALGPVSRLTDPHLGDLRLVRLPAGDLAPRRRVMETIAAIKKPNPSWRRSMTSGLAAAAGLFRGLPKVASAAR